MKTKLLFPLLAILLTGCICSSSTPSSETTDISDTEVTYTDDTVPEVDPVQPEPNRAEIPCRVISQTEPTTDFADDIPLYPNATQFMAECREEKYAEEYSLRYRTYDDLEEVYKYLKSEMLSAGWEITSENQQADSMDSYNYYMLLSGQKNNWDRSITYDIRNELYRSDGAGEIIVRENYTYEGKE